MQQQYTFNFLTISLKGLILNKASHFDYSVQFGNSLWKVNAKFLSSFHCLFVNENHVSKRKKEASILDFYVHTENALTFTRCLLFYHLCKKKICAANRRISYENYG